MGDDATTLREWAASLGWSWPDGTPTPPGVYADLGRRLDVSPYSVREVYSGRRKMPAAWRARWSSHD